MGAPVPPEIVAQTAKDVIAFVVTASEPGTNGSPPRGVIRIEEALRGELVRGASYAATFPPPNDESFYVFREQGEIGVASWSRRPRHGPSVGEALVAIVWADETGVLAVDARGCWPDTPERRARIRNGSG